jgi:hypothetical protein
MLPTKYEINVLHLYLYILYSMCNQEHKENSEYENFGNANVAASSLMLFNGSGKEDRL